MEMGETVQAANAIQAQDKCVICGTKHENAKKETIESVVNKKGWERRAKLKCDVADANRMSIYPDARFPPPYRTEGHHAIVFTSFIKDGRDQCVRLNHFLNDEAVGFQANHPVNIICLPGRTPEAGPPPRKEPDDPPTSWPVGVKKEYKNYWVSIDWGHPLQLHTGDHKQSYHKKSDLLYRSMMRKISKAGGCPEKTLDDFKENLKKLITGATNYAYAQVASGAWKCHPEHLQIAQQLYGRTGNNTITYHQCSRGARAKKTLTVEGVGYPGRHGGRPADGQSVSLDTHPY